MLANPLHSILRFNSRTSCEVRRGLMTKYFDYDQFQLTHLLRGATGGHLPVQSHAGFNSRTSCEVRRGLMTKYFDYDQFQLTHLLRGATPTPPFMAGGP